MKERVKKFSEIYRNEIFPKIKYYEEKRAKLFAYRKEFAYRICGFIHNCGGFGFLLCLVLAAHLSRVNQIAFLVLIVTAFTCSFAPLVYMGLKDDKIPQFVNEFKKECLPLILKAFGDITWCSKKGIIPMYELDQSGLFDRLYTNIYSDDEFYGIYNGVKFRVAELDMVGDEIKTSNKQNSVFRRLVLLFENNKRVLNRTVITKKRQFFVGGNILIAVYVGLAVLIFALPLSKAIMRDFKSGIVGTLFFVSFLAFVYFLKFKINNADRYFSYETTNLEDPLFTKEYEISTLDQIEARYLITPAFMERFRNLEKVFDAKEAQCAFYSDKIMISLSVKKDMFEIGSVDESFEDPAVFSRLFNEINAIYELIDYFKLSKE